MQTSPLVSIIVPIYNVESYLEKCLQSIVSQTHANIEILLIDDGSTDRSLDICRTFAERDARIRVVHLKKAGVSVARNTGLEMASGEYICFVDSDDWVDKDYVSALLRLLRTCRADISVIGFMEERNGQSRPANRHLGIRIWNMPTAYRKLCFDKELKSHICGKLFKRKLFQEIRFPVGQVYEDIAIMGDLVSQTKRMAVNYAPKYHYFIPPGSITQSKNKMEYQWCRMQALYNQFTLGISLGIFKRYPPRFLRRCIRFADKVMLMEETEETLKYMEGISRYLRLYDGQYLGIIGLKVWMCKRLILRHPEFYRQWIRRIKS